VAIITLMTIIGIKSAIIVTCDGAKEINQSYQGEQNKR